MTITLDQVQALADQLNSVDKARLAARLNIQLVNVLAPDQQVADGDTSTTDPWEQLLAFRRDMEGLGANAPNFAAELESDRRTRAETLEGRARVHS